MEMKTKPNNLDDTRLLGVPRMDVNEYAVKASVAYEEWKRNHLVAYSYRKWREGMKRKRIARIKVSYKLLAELLGWAAKGVDIIEHYPHEPWRDQIEFLVEGEPFSEILEYQQVPEYIPTYTIREDGYLEVSKWADEE